MNLACQLFLDFLLDFIAAMDLLGLDGWNKLMRNKTYLPFMAR